MLSVIEYRAKNDEPDHTSVLAHGQGTCDTQHMRWVVLATLGLLPVESGAETPMSAADFEARVTGKTLTYSNEGVAYGAEEYLSDRRVRWSFLDGECQEGRWYVAGDQICFVYDDIPDPQCWRFYVAGLSLIHI